MANHPWHSFGGMVLPRPRNGLCEVQTGAKSNPLSLSHDGPDPQAKAGRPRKTPWLQRQETCASNWCGSYECGFWTPSRAT